MIRSKEIQILLKKSHEDLVLLAKIVGDLTISDAIYGFHAHQSLEKMIKAVLTNENVEFPKSHDIGYLLDLLPVNKKTIFSPVEDVGEDLNPFAVALRYDDIIDIAINREEILKVLNEVFQNVCSLLNIHI